MRVASVLAGALSAAVMLSAAAAQAGEVRVTVQNVQPRAGQLVATLQTEAQFMQPAGAYGATAQPPAQAGAVTFVFSDVAPGEYAFSVIHDEDGNHQLRFSSEGMPSEGVAMSNGSSLMGPPTFPDVKFTVGAAPVTLTEQMFYFAQ